MITGAVNVLLVVTKPQGIITHLWHMELFFFIFTFFSQCSFHMQQQLFYQIYTLALF